MEVENQCGVGGR